MKYLAPAAAVLGVVGALATATPAMANNDEQNFSISKGLKKYASVSFKANGDVTTLCAEWGRVAKVEIRKSTGNSGPFPLVYEMSVTDKEGGRDTCETVKREYRGSKYDLPEGKEYVLILSTEKASAGYGLSKDRISERHTIYNDNDRNS